MQGHLNKRPWSSGHEHCKFCCRRTNDVESQVVIPRKTIEKDPSVSTLPLASLFPTQALQTTLTQLVPLPNQRSDMVLCVRLERPHARGGKYVAHNLPLPRMLRPTPGVEQSPPNAHECIVEVSLECPVPVRVDRREGVGVVDGDAVQSSQISVRLSFLFWALTGSARDARKSHSVGGEHVRLRSGVRALLSTRARHRRNQQGRGLRLCSSGCGACRVCKGV